MKKFIFACLVCMFSLVSYAQLNVSSDINHQVKELCKSKKYGNYGLSLVRTSSSKDDNALTFIIRCGQSTNRFDSYYNYIKLGSSKEEVIESLKQLLELCDKKTNIYIDNNKTHLKSGSAFGQKYLDVKTSPNAGYSCFYKKNLERFLNFMLNEYTE